jgi:hypothetical protein
LDKLSVPRPTAIWIAKQMEINRVSLLPIRLAHQVGLETLPPLHRDPFDRMLVAQANALSLPSDVRVIRNTAGRFCEARDGLRNPGLKICPPLPGLRDQ